MCATHKIHISLAMAMQAIKHATLGEFGLLIVGQLGASFVQVRCCSDHARHARELYPVVCKLCPDCLVATRTVPHRGARVSRVDCKEVLQLEVNRAGRAVAWIGRVCARERKIPEEVADGRDLFMPLRHRRPNAEIEIQS